MKWQIIILTLAGIFSVIACRKDPPLPEPEPTCEECFAIKFYFVNEGDTVTDLKNIAIESVAYSDTLDMSYIKWVTYLDSAYAAEFAPTHPPEAYLKDSFLHDSIYPCTVGSAKNFQITISYRDSMGAQYRTQRFILSDTTNVFITDPSEAVEIFHWPSDTNRYIKLFDIWN